MDLIKARHSKVMLNYQQVKKKQLVKDANHLVYSLGHNCVFLRMGNKMMDSHYNWMALREFNNWGQPLVIDFSFFKSMRLSAAYSSLMYIEIPNALSANRTSAAPFQVFFLNYCIY